MDITELKAGMTRLNGIVDGRLGAVEKENADLNERLSEIEAKSDEPGMRGKNREAGERKAFTQYLRSGDESEMKAMSIGAGAAAGGAMVPELIANEIIDKALAMSQLSQTARRTQTGTSDYVRLLNLRGQAAAWSSESGTRSETSSLLLREIRPTHGELYAVVGMTRWLLDDAKFNLSDESSCARLQSQARN